MKRKPVFNLTPYERRIEAELERGEWKPVPKKESERLRVEFVKAAARTIKGARVNLRLNPGVVALIRRKAAREGIPYQTLIASILHKYATDQLVDESAIRKVVSKLGGARSDRKRASG